LCLLTMSFVLLDVFSRLIVSDYAITSTFTTFCWVLEQLAIIH
jgi:hypothetical protein